MKDPVFHPLTSCISNNTCRHSDTSPTFLLPKVMHCLHLDERCLAFDLCMQDIPCHAKPPFCLESVHISAKGGEIRENDCDSIVLVFPLQLCIRDACGEQYHVTSVLCHSHGLHGMHFPEPDDYAITSAFVRLHHPVRSDTCCFHVTLSLCADVYFLKHTVVHSAIPDFCSDAKPIYPPPCNPKCCKQK